MTDKLKSFPALIIGAALAAGAGFIANKSWDVFGWMTPEQHRADVEQVDSNSTALGRLEDRWDCYNLQSRVDELLRLDDATPLDLEAIRRLQEKMNTIGCAQYYE